MSRVKKSAPRAEQRVYVGPTIPGVAKENTIYRGDLPPELTAAMEQTPALAGLVVFLEDLPAAQAQLRNGGALATLYRKVKSIHRA